MKQYTSDDLRRLIAVYGTVTAFAKAVPVSRRMATYWLEDPKKRLHPKWHARLREMSRETRMETNRKER
jgi:hypothetical protein